MNMKISGIQREISDLKEENLNQQSTITELGKKLQIAEAKISSACCV